MRLSKSFSSTLKETPAEATIASHQLMLRAGLVKQLASGIYAWLPLGLKVLQNISALIREGLDDVGGQEILMPTLQSAQLWKRSGRYDSYGPEMLKMNDRHKRELVYSPTNEEMVTDLFEKCVNTYKELPQFLYQLQWKFRDEIRPRFGIMRAREFYMQDGYSFDEDGASAQLSYYKMFFTYLKIFRKIGVRAVPMRAATGEMGGELSHEFLVLAPTGESAVYYDKALEEPEDLDKIHLDDPKELAQAYKHFTQFYAATEEMHSEEKWAGVNEDRKRSGRGIEVGHIFSLGQKYTEAMGASLAGPDGKFFPYMGCYGIGVSRLVGAVIEASHDENGIIWPSSIAPYQAVVINLKVGDTTCDEICEKIYRQAPRDLIYDDRNQRAGGKFADADLIGYPWQIIVGPRNAKNGSVEVKCRRTGERFEVSADEVLSRISTSV